MNTYMLLWSQSHTTHLWPMMFPLPPDLLQTSHPLLQPSAKSIDREGPFNTARANTHLHTVLLLGRDGDCHSPDPDTAGLCVNCHLRSGGSWLVCCVKQNPHHFCSIHLISSYHKRKKKKKLYKSNTWCFISIILANIWQWWHSYFLNMTCINLLKSF